MLEEALLVLADVVAWCESESRPQTRVPSGRREAAGTVVSP